MVGINMSNKKYKFVTAKPGKKPVTYFKAEEELEDHELESLYQQFACNWDFQPLKNKNRFLQWLITESAKLKKS